MVLPTTISFRDTIEERTSMDRCSFFGITLCLFSFFLFSFFFFFRFFLRSDRNAVPRNDFSSIRQDIIQSAGMRIKFVSDHPRELFEGNVGRSNETLVTGSLRSQRVSDRWQRV